MAIETDKLSGAETLRKTRTYGKVRCHNPSCMERLVPAPGADHVKCPTCGLEFRIFWVKYIDLSTGKIETKPIPLEVRKKFLGGRGLDAYLLYNHTKKGCDPLGPDNTLMISGGILTATCASATARTHVMAKSPLTGLLGSANMGGFFAPELAWAGFHHLVIKGKAEKPVYIWIHNGEIEIRDAANLWGKTTTETQWAKVPS